MKFLLVLLVVLIGFYVWRSSRAQRAKPPRDAAVVPGVVDMVPCAQCGVHCARDEAVVGKAGVYCTTQHRSLSES